MTIMSIQIRRLWFNMRPFIHSKRHISRAAHPHINTAAEAASYLMDNFANKVIHRRQLIDANQLQKLAVTLGRPILEDTDVRKTSPPIGTRVPAGHHLAYFTPDNLESELGADGSDQMFNAPAPFTRRMWAGGRISFNTHKPLRVGDDAHEVTKLISATAKKSRSGGEMVLVGVEKRIYGSDGEAMVDERSWIFRPTIDSKSTLDLKPREFHGDVLAPSSVRNAKEKGHVFPIRHLSWSPVGLFRFSALTFNGHKIHYNEDWTQTTEGHPGVVVHGPLNLINLLDYWSDVHGDGAEPSEISYRAMSPVYAGEKYQIRTENISGTDEHRIYEILAECNDVVIMKASISK